MSDPLAEYLSALDARDAREKAHEGYVNAYTKLADNTAQFANQTPSAEESAPAASASKGKGPATTDVSSPSAIAQLRSELAVTQRTRGDLESQLSALTAELSTLKASDTQQKQRIEQLEKVRTQLERRSKDRTEELKGKGRLVEEVHDEMVALNLQLNMAEQEKEKLRKENEELTKRWVKKMEEEARKMNERSGWEDQSRRKK
ncbi:hypothetical protein AA0113_g7530 [Alternaria arborescens]|uniref:Autophagy-related protein 16 domain-containing protein n=1 Tax=Alternaria arborescens TaxID=156630 RepID=A0A4Q4RRK6_9PLEO|nr:hypothetical protein AA0111_g10186 [Alternaria arborescens]RYN27328.1 hypothetical protein AA0112_g7876 [Alternaria arborescens]RYO19882.1 hypothetical protein AA0111_g10186 [Alternaria arborescens]RYO59765.1 hypothetical protein AA0113_g7530 [Alternaria arborescens]